MAESRGSLLAKSVQKHAGRAKEKLLQNLGKVDRTADEIFDEHLENFTRQQNAANRLQKEFSNYIRCIRATQAASKTLFEAIGETYESQWTGHDQLYIQTQQIDILWQDFSHKLADQVLLPLNTYQSQFPEMRKKIDKRGRKLIDYDNQRHSFQALQTNMKKRDDVKIAKGREQLEEAKRTYEILNSELHDELPALYDSRVLFLVTNLQSLFNAEDTFHSESAKIFSDLESIVDKLATDSQRGSYNVKKTNGTNSLPRPKNALLKESPELIVNNVQSKRAVDDDTANSVSQVDTSPSPAKANNNSLENSKSDSVPITPNSTTSVPASPTTPTSPISKELTKSNTANNNAVCEPSVDAADTTNKLDAVADVEPVVKEDNKRLEELYDIPVGASTEHLPPGVLYRVKATYKYTREDVDELSFEVGEIISVIEYDDPDEQEEGWLMGVKDNGDKGMFPANFTRPL
ncbi:myc box-dependent-interacting protein 1 isoform X1 [Anthonomus grandis grandis]|uniref:myc box-dependent-interacting protein 1 isoform X1 n=1 Tax=Anthonomus grandis grandis TaxID=2921223 RepID=UPI0021651935|nr:myc box-dependent-interacting protein 1 isoform X1 [Anthonomus grandis grandis]